MCRLQAEAGHPWLEFLRVLGVCPLVCLLGVCLLAHSCLLGKGCVFSSACPRPSCQEGTLPSSMKDQRNGLDLVTCPPDCMSSEVRKVGLSHSDENALSPRDRGQDYFPEEGYGGSHEGVDFTALSHSGPHVTGEEGLGLVGGTLVSKSSQSEAWSQAWRCWEKSLCGGGVGLGGARGAYSGKDLKRAWTWTP